jgi:hypothetical protein
LLPPFLDGLDEVRDGLVRSHIIVPVAPRGKAHSEVVECMHLEMIVEVLEHVKVGESCGSEAMQADEMRSIASAHCVNLMNVLVAIDGNISEAEVFFSSAKPKSFSVYL